MTIIWGGNFTAIKYSLVEGLLPLSFNGLRFVIASLTLLLVLVVSGRTLKVTRRDGWRMFGLGMLANALYQSLFINGVAHTRTGNAALIVSTTPLFTAIIGRIRNHEHFTAKGGAGLVLAFAGIVLIVISGGSEIEFGTNLLGDGLLIASVICWSLYTVGAKRYLHAYGPMAATAFMMITGTPVFLVICAPSLLRQNWSAVSPLAWAGLAYSAFLAIALSHSIWNYGVRKIGSTRTAIYSNITPVTALVVAWVALDETPTPGQILGALVIFTGLYLVRHGLIAVAPPEEVEEEMEEATLGPGKV
ncbi:MAG TPA: DMT family transporter [Blastocatellia bacterium]|nr:DMT family transporter [Blastocatellia bacterium]